ncbi:hypothetical protein QNO07_25650 [Streptomyces sp. 549]|uniref:hypothetical protein n=1 Tax=Streptomyces sp. 549 TaxID=3049076 RepID=UPI0024C43F88|nr:hypothetical protein [Streptomyces sp. 549]MDK1476745.1 hypothetical protein [Streptomyces sp. 549]
MTFKKRYHIAAAALVLGLGAQTFAAPSATAESTRSFAASEEAVPGVAPLDADSTAVYLDGSGKEIDMSAGEESTSTPSALAGCTPYSGRDNPHYSRGDVSGHGWWKKGTCTKDRADVYNCLYEWYTDNSWRQKACSPKKRLRPYTGSGDRTVAREV